MEQAPTSDTRATAPFRSTGDGPQDLPRQLTAKPVRHPLQWVAAAVLLLLIAMLAHALIFARISRGDATETRFGWEIIGNFFLTGTLLRALLVTLELTVLSMSLGIIGGVILAVMRLSQNALLSSCSLAYIWFFRGTPLLVQLLFWYNLSYIFPELSLGIPFGPSFITFNANQVVTPFIAAFAGLGLNEAAYMSEIVRAGILSVDAGQWEAAQSLGMTRLLTLRRIVLPQAMRVIIPPTGNETIGMLKNTSLASVITVVELLYSTELIYSRTFQTVPMLIVASLWYLIVTTVLSIGQYYLERHFGRGSSSSNGNKRTPLRRFRSILMTSHATLTGTTGRLGAAAATEGGHRWQI